MAATKQRTAQSSERHTHASAALYHESYDYASYTGKPLKELMVASIPRAGSANFCLELWRTGVLGAPLEYLNFNICESVGRWSKHLGDMLEYWRVAQTCRTSSNGVFSYKMFTSCYGHIVERCPEFMPLLGPSHVVYLTREDTVAQAVSYAKAIRSGAWFHGAKARSDLEYCRSDIQACEQSILQQMSFWERIFALTQTAVLRVTYEDLMRDGHAVIAKVARFVEGNEVQIGRVGIPTIGIQRDQSSIDWGRRYTEDAVNEAAQRQPLQP